MIQTNLIPNPSFTSGTTNWAATGTGTTITAMSDGGYTGVYYLKVNKVAPNTNVGVITDVTSISIVVGNSYTASTYVKIPTGSESGSLAISISFYTSGNSLIGSAYTSTPQSVTSASGWVRLQVTQVAPATSAYAKISVIQTSTPSINDVFYIDSVQFQNSAYVTSFVEPINQLQENTKTNNVLRPVPPPHLTGIELNADIMINNLLLNTIDNNNILWVCTDIEGWWDLPDPEIQDLTRGLDDGSYDVRGRYTARVMTLVGSILVPDRSYTAAARDRLISAINLVATGGWLIVDENPTKAAYVRLSGRPSIKVVNPRGRIDFSVGLKAANPVKFKWNWNDANGYASTTIAAAGSTVINNEGNFDVPMVLTMTGGSGGLTAPITVTNTTTGKTLTVIKNIRGSSYNVSISTSQVASGVVTLGFGATVHSFLVGDVVNVASISTAGRTGLNTTGAVITSVTDTTISFAKTTGDLASAATNGTVTLASQDTLEIDTYNKSATFNGSASIARSYIDTLTDWIYLQPGNNTIQFTPTSGSTTLAVKYRSGWIG